MEPDDKVTLRPLIKSVDMLLVQRWLGDDKATEYFSPYLRRNWLEEIEQDKGVHFIIDLKSGIPKMVKVFPVGLCTIREIMDDGSDGTLVILIGNHVHRRKGIGTEAIKQLIDYAFNNLGLHRVTSYIFHENYPSLRMHEKLGFRFEGRMLEKILKNGERHNIIIVSMLAKEWRNSRSI